jgi:hypothetical protein
MVISSRVRLLSTALAVALAAGCQVHMTPTGGAAEPAPAYAEDGPPPGQPPADQPPAPGSTGGATAGGVSAACHAANNHCLDEDVVFTATRGYAGRTLSVEPSKVVRSAAGGGEGEYMSLRSGENRVTEHAFVTRPVAHGELAVGQLAAVINRYRTRGGVVYRHPESRDEAQGRDWWIGRIASIPTVEGGEVIFAGGRRVESGAIRLVVGDDMPALQTVGAEDAHYLRDDHWIVSNQPLPKGRTGHAQVAVAIQPPAAGRDGQFFELVTGTVLWSGNAWRTRVATEADLTVGTYVFAINRYHTRGGVLYRPPENRPEALSHGWWMGRIVDTSEVYKGVVEVAGGRKVQVAALRVAY